MKLMQRDRLNFLISCLNSYELNNIVHDRESKELNVFVSDDDKIDFDSLIIKIKLILFNSNKLHIS